MTSLPEDMFNVAYIQLNLARDGLPADKLKDAVTAVMQVLSEVLQSIVFCPIAYKSIIA